MHSDTQQRPPLAATAQRAIRQLAGICPASALNDLHADELLMERAWITGAQFRHGQSTHGSSRLLSTLDGTLAVTLARGEDWGLLPAWLEHEQAWHSGYGDSAWRRLAADLAGRRTDCLVERARTLGLAVAPVGMHRQARTRDNTRLARLFPATPGSQTHAAGTRGSAMGVQPAPRAAPLVIDLSALWAGPLCTHLLDLCGADVIRVESSNRPDGARSGNAAFYELLNQNKRSVALDLTTAEGRRWLGRLLAQADIVIESSRPRALRQMGIQADALVQQNPSLIWVSITGYGRSEPEANWVAFGDDAGVAAGLSDIMQAATGAYEFAGDAIADPLTGIHAALAAWSAWCGARGGLIELALADVAAWCLLQETAQLGADEVVRGFGNWWRQVSDRAPRTGYTGRTVTGDVAELGEHTDAVLRELAELEARGDGQSC